MYRRFQNRRTVRAEFAAKIDRIEHKEIEQFKTHVLNTEFHGMTIKQWSNILSSKDEAKLEYALKTLL